MTGEMNASSTLKNFMKIKNSIRNLEIDPLINRIVFPEMKSSFLEIVKMLKQNSYIEVAETKICEEMKIIVFLKKKGHQNISLSSNAYTLSMEIALIEIGSDLWKAHYNNIHKTNPLDLANFIIKWANRNNAFMNNLKINEIISYAFYDGVIDLDEIPKRSKHFYQIESMYNEFKHHGAEHISSTPSDLTLLEDKSTESKRYSDLLLENLEYTNKNYGNYLTKLIRRFDKMNVFEIQKEIDEKRKQSTK